MSYLDILENDYPGPEAFLENCLKPAFGTAPKTNLPLTDKLSDSEKSIIKDIFIFGNTDNFVVNDMNFFDVTVQDNVDIARSRVTIQRAVRKSLDNYQAAIVIFHHSDNAGLWRFSFIYKEGSAKDTTSARRYSYLCGKGQHCRTATDNLEKLENIPGKKKLEDVTTVFSIEALTKDFFNRLFKWYDTWAVTTVRFPVGKGKNAQLPKTIDETAKKENRQHLIRLITRLIFVWFLKHKEDLVPDWIFDVRELKEFINNFNEHDGKSGSYYNAILQNLFFATLNCEINKREFFDDEDGRNGYSIKAQFRDHVDKPMIKIPHDEFIKKFETIPFLNGGLFECLDHREGHEEQEYQDGFSRESKRAAFVPNCLFFGDGEHKGEGLINIFSEYNFTIEENTPQDIEVALDPELLGKVFENLLGTYNEETASTARKESGSFYTPREIVEYMVDISLKEYFKTKLNISPQTETDKNLGSLFSRAIEDHDFSKNQATILIEAIYHCRILDPACGSGAFPMGILNKLVFILEKLDPENNQWKEIQIQKAIKETEEAYRTGDDEERKERLGKIQEVFEQSTGQHANYARKLYLIENCIYGVDIQAIAIQISKLRFFISLIVDQKTGGTKVNNYNVLPLPNLETKFVAANTLIGIKREHDFLADPKIEDTQKELLEIRHKHFSPRTVREKDKLREKDVRLTKLLLELLKKDGFFNLSDAALMAKWNPYSQTDSADFFDAWWMFGIKDGFNVVIGNPPYLNVEHLDPSMKDQLFNNYKTCKGRTDIYIAFIEKSLFILKPNGINTFIVPYAYTNQNYAELSRKNLVLNYTINEILDASNYYIFENAVVKNIIIVIINRQHEDRTKIRIAKSSASFIKNIFDERIINTKDFLKLENTRFSTGKFENLLALKDRIEKGSLKFENICFIAYGVRINHKRDKNKPKQFYLSEKEIKGYKKYIEGKNIKRYCHEQNGWINYKPQEHYNSMFPELFENEKIITINVVSKKLRFSLDKEFLYDSHTVINCVRLDKLLRVKHISTKKAIKDNDCNVAKQFAIEYLLGILNSKLINWYFLNFQSEGLHFYPDDAKRLPIFNACLSDQKKISNLVNKILATKAIDPQADTSALERQIDNLVYRLYNLTYDEVKVIEPDFPLNKAEYDRMEAGE